MPSIQERTIYYYAKALPDRAHPTLHHSVGAVGDSYMIIQYHNLHKRFLNFLCYFHEAGNLGYFYSTSYDLTIKLSSISRLTDIYYT